jgi:hypothetical protein
MITIMTERMTHVSKYFGPGHFGIPLYSFMPFANHTRHGKNLGLNCPRCEYREAVSVLYLLLSLCFLTVIVELCVNETKGLRSALSLAASVDSIRLLISILELNEWSHRIIFSSPHHS